MDLRVLGRRIARLRKEKGLTQRQLAEMAGVSVQALRSWENGRREPSVAYVPLLAAALYVGTDELLGYKLPREPIRPPARPPMGRPYPPKGAD